jgi:hypothetical protein
VGIRILLIRVIPKIKYKPVGKKRLLVGSENSLCQKQHSRILALLVEVCALVGRKLKLVFIDDDGKLCQLDEVNSSELAQGLERISKETAKRLLLQKEER